MLTYHIIVLYDIAIYEVVMVRATEVQLLISFFNFLTGNTDIVQSLSRRRMVEYLLKKQKLSVVVVRHYHLVISKSFAERVSGHLRSNV